MTSPVGRLTVVVAVLVLLTGCNDETGAASEGDSAEAPTSEQVADAPPAASAEPSESTSVDIGVDSDGASDLAEAAEGIAGEEPQPGSIDPRSEPVLGADASWPQCPKGMGIPDRPTQGSPMPIDAAEFVILGLTNGPGFTPNPCLADQVQWIRDRGLMMSAYSVLSYPTEAQLQEYGSEGPYDADDRLGRLRNVGHAQATYNLATMQAAGLQTPAIWLDVETVPGYDWGEPEANAAVIEGAARGYRDAGYRIGVYSTAYIWGEIAGDFQLGIPEWRAAGQTSRAEAERRCGADSVIQGGEAVLGQWVEAGRDHNITCNGSERDLARWFAPS